MSLVFTCNCQLWPEGSTPECSGCVLSQAGGTGRSLASGLNSPHFRGPRVTSREGDTALQPTCGLAHSAPSPTQVPKAGTRRTAFCLTAGVGRKAESQLRRVWAADREGKGEAAASWRAEVRGQRAWGAPWFRAGRSDTWT